MVSLDGYLYFIRNVMGITDQQLPDDSIYITWSYNTSIDEVNPVLQTISENIYTICVYNLAGDILINIAQDEAGETIFSDLRKSWDVNAAIIGWIQASSDESTSQTLIAPDYGKNLTLKDLQNLKTPYGRTYLRYAQSYGTIWGLT